MSEFERRLAELAGEAGGAARLEPASMLRRRGQRRATRRRAAGGTLLALLVFSPMAVANSCAGSPKADPLPPAASTSPSTVSAPAPTPAPSQSPAQQTGCRITVSAAHEDGAGGHSSTALLLRNNGTEVCSLRGYPAVAALDSSGNVVAQAKQTPKGYMGGLTQGDPPAVTIAPGELASALFETLNANPDGTACKTYAALRVTAPGQKDPVTVTWGSGGCADPQIHPVVPGDTGRK